MCLEEYADEYFDIPEVARPCYRFVLLESEEKRDLILQPTLMVLPVFKLSQPQSIHSSQNTFVVSPADRNPY